MSDGELDEGSTWEAAMGAAHHRLDNLICLVDINDQQADGPSTQGDGFRAARRQVGAFGWHVQRVDGNDLAAVIAAFDAARNLPDAKPRVILCDTLDGQGRALPRARAKRTTSSASIRLSGSWRPRHPRPRPREPPDEHHRQETAPDHLGDDCLDRGRRAARDGRALRQGPGRLAAASARRSSASPPTWQSTPTCISSRRPTPNAFIQMGMAEQLLIAAAGGMAKEGLVPFATTYAVFGTRRAYDFIHQVIAEENLNVKICCALPGLTTGYGPSHQATEDIAMMRGVPGLTIVDPCDALDIEQAVPQIAAHPGPVYLRLLRGQVPRVLDEIEGYRFELGRAKLLRDGADVLVIASGLLTMRALEAAADLAHDRIGVAVLHCPTVKPLDEAAIVEAVRHRHRLVVVAENHSVVGGLGEAVASALMRHRVQPAGFQLAGLPDAFLDAGALPTLHDRYGISRTALAGRIKGWLA
jgi:transketolase